MSPNDLALFTKIAEAVNPGWDLTLRDWQPGGAMPMADLWVFAYAADTSNGWVTGTAATARGA